MRPVVAWLLAINGGYVDTAGFLALQGLFTAHVTGNFVTLGASLVLGISGIGPKLLALPVFCLVVALTRMLGRAMAGRPVQRPRVLIMVKLAALIIACAFAVGLGPFPDGDTPGALLTGMTLVTAMAIQNALQRVHLTGLPATTLMTGNTTQLVMDAVDLFYATGSKAERSAKFQHMRWLGIGIGCFGSGCALAAFLFWQLGMWCFLFPPLTAFAVLIVTGMKMPASRTPPETTA